MDIVHSSYRPSQTWANNETNTARILADITPGLVFNVRLVWTPVLQYQVVSVKYLVSIVMLNKENSIASLNWFKWLKEMVSKPAVTEKTSNQRSGLERHWFLLIQPH